LYLVILEQAPEPAAGGRESNPSTEQAGMDADTRVAELKRELQAKEEYLQTANEELETSNEELKSSNEEMQSVNEELQSSNEELATVNAEMQTKVADLSRSNNDMNNLLAGTGIATIFVDIRLRILRFTPAATKIINLIPSDIGRPVGHVVSNLPGYATLTADTQAVLDTLIPKQLDVRSADGRCYTMRILPYRTMDNVIEGAVLTFVDITESKQAEAPIRASDERLRVALSATSIVLFTQDTDLRYTWMHNPNPGFRTEHVIGKTDADLLPHEEAAALTAIKQQVLKGGKGVRQNVRITIEGKTLIYDLTIEPRRDAVGAIIGITCASLNITGKQR
jgi:two-component system CheB/CheR fusion protein